MRGRPEVRMPVSATGSAAALLVGGDPDAGPVAGVPVVVYDV